MTRLLIIGAGGHAKVLADALVAAGTPPAGLLDADPARRGGAVLGLPILGGDEVLDGLDPAGVLLVNGVGSTGRADSRRGVQERLAARGFRFAVVRHPSAVIGGGTALEEGAQVMAGAVVQAGSRIGVGAIVNTRASVDHDCRIGAFAHLAPGAVVCGGVAVGADSHVGAGAVVIQGRTVGAGCLIAAGAVVVADVGDGLRVRGVPARPVEG